MSKEKIVRIWGGLGNQLFQYSFCKYLERNFDYKIKLNLNWFYGQNQRKFILNDYLKIDYELINEDDCFKDKILNYKTENIYKYFIKKNIRFSPKKLIGYWQDLNFAKQLTEKNFKENLFINNDYTKEKYYVLHFRGGDFFKSKDHVVLNNKYYENCLELFKDEKIYCLTDDIKSMTEVLNKINRKNLELLKLGELDAFKLIVNSEGGIASNSTFCWWGAFLSKKKKWIFPKKWLKKKTLISQNLFIDGTLVL